MAGLRPQLPENIYSIEVREIDPSDVNVLQIALISENASNATMKKVAEDLQEDLERISSLKNVKISGLTELLIRIDVKPELLAKLIIPLKNVMRSEERCLGKECVRTFRSGWSPDN